MGPLTITTKHITDTKVHRAIEDADSADEEFFIRDEKVLTYNVLEEDNLENSEIERASNLSSSTGIETDLRNEEEKTVRRSKRLTKPTQLLDIITQFVMITGIRKKTELGDPTESTRSRTGEGGRHPINQTLYHQIQTIWVITNRDNQNSEELLSVHQALDQWTNDRYREKQIVPIGRSSANSRRRNV